MRYLFRAADPTDAQPLPQWKAWRGLLFVAGRLSVLWVAGLFHAGRRRLVLMWLLMIVGLVVQLVMILVAAYLVDLAISLMELWADLARKHLELTL